MEAYLIQDEKKKKKNRSLTGKYRTLSKLKIYEIIQKYKPPFTEEEIAAIEEKIHNAYPFGQRKNYPYKVWLEEVKKFKLYLRGIGDGTKTALSNKNDKKQLGLFDLNTMN